MIVRRRVVVRIVVVVDVAVVMVLAVMVAAVVVLVLAVAGRTAFFVSVHVKTNKTPCTHGLQPGCLPDTCICHLRPPAKDKPAPHGSIGLALACVHKTVR